MLYCVCMCVMCAGKQTESVVEKGSMLSATAAPARSGRAPRAPAVVSLEPGGPSPPPPTATLHITTHHPKPRTSVQSMTL